VIPIGDSNEGRGTPWVNYALILLNFAVFLYMLSLSTSEPRGAFQRAQQRAALREGSCYGLATTASPSDRFVCSWAFQPKEFFDTVQGHSDVAQPDKPVILVSVITGMFLHAGWLHILGNMLFLWVFGANVERRMGHAGYLLFYFVAGIAATLVQGLIDPSSIIPVLGASGAIAGVLGAYIVWFPRSTIRVVLPFFPLFFIPLPIPAFIMIGVWFAQNFLAGLASVNDAAQVDQGVAFFAHIGGFVFGMVIALVWRRRPRRQRSYRGF
jgi:membrane associated rhomboid family serine protease